VSQIYGWTSTVSDLCGRKNIVSQLYGWINTVSQLYGHKNTYNFLNEGHWFTDTRAKRRSSV